MRRLLATVLLVLTARDLAVEHWLKKRIGPANDALAADPARMVIAAKVRAQLQVCDRENLRALFVNKA